MSYPSVLIVDDHEGFRAIARDLLSNRGFAVVGEAAGGWQALREAARLRPAAILLDVQLPDIDGFEVTRRLRAGLRDVLELMAEGRSNLAISERLGLTERTVEGNVRIILSKLGLEPAGRRPPPRSRRPHVPPRSVTTGDSTDSG